MTGPEGYIYEDAQSLTTWARRSVLATLLVSSVAVLSGLLEYNLLTAMRDGAFDSEEEMMASAASNDVRQLLVALLQMGLTIVSGFLSLRWIHRSNSNARALGATRLDFTPGWSVGWYFIPFMNLWKPYQAMKELWQASAQPRDWQLQTTPALLGWWWLLWVTSTVLGNGAFRMQMRADEVEELITANVVTVMSDAVMVPLCVVFALIVQRIHDMQTRHVVAPPPVVEVAPASIGGVG